jgi:hypothetical protein
MKGIVYTAQGGGDEIEWRCDYCRRRNQKPSEQ